MLTSHQASILDHLDERDPLTLGELAQHMGVTPGTMSIHVDRLEAAGYVRRRRSRRDGRRVTCGGGAAGGTGGRSSCG